MDLEILTGLVYMSIPKYKVVNLLILKVYVRAEQQSGALQPMLINRAIKLKWFLQKQIEIPKPDKIKN